MVCVVMVASFALSPVKVSAMTINAGNEAQIQLLVQLLTVLKAMLAELQRGNAGTSVGTGVMQNADEEATLSILKYDEVPKITLGSSVKGKKLLTFRVDARDVDTDVVMKKIPVALAVPFVKAGDWTDMIQNVILVSEKTQDSVAMSNDARSDAGGWDIDGVVHDEVFLNFNIPTSHQKAFTVPKGTSRDFMLIADFDPAERVGAFGNLKDESVGCVRASILFPIQSTVSIFGEETTGQCITVRSNEIVQDSNDWQYENLYLYSTTIATNILTWYGEQTIPNQLVTVRIGTEDAFNTEASSVDVDMYLYEKISTEAGGTGTWRKTDYFISRRITTSHGDGVVEFTIDVPGSMTQKYSAQYKLKIEIDTDNNDHESDETDNTGWTSVWSTYHYE